MASDTEQSIKPMSDGIVLELSGGRTVRPVIENASGEKLIANAIYLVDQYAEYGVDADETYCRVWFEDCDIEAPGDQEADDR